MRFLFALFGLGVISCQLIRAGESLHVLAAASLTEPLTELAVDFTRQSGVTVRLQFGGSGTLVRQIVEGAPADLFLSADELRMDTLAKKDLLLPDALCNLASNQLVMVIPSVAAENPVPLRDPADLTAATVRRVALGDSDIVPAGAYARDYLQSVDLWDDIRPKVIPLPSVRAVLAAVESGSVDAGFVYRTDAALSTKVLVTYAVPVSQGPHIVYPAAVLRSSKQPEVARQFLNYLVSPEARAVFASFGFAPPPGE